MAELIRCSCFCVNREALADLESTLRGNGFAEPPQIAKVNQRFGLAKPVDEVWQFHLRGYSDGQLEGEVELRWIYIEHSTHPSYSAHEFIQKLLDENDIHYKMETPPPHCANPQPLQPETVTEWMQLEGEAIARSIVNTAAGERISVRELKETLQKLAASLSAFSTSTISRIIDFQAGKQNLRVRVDCPVFKVCQDWCEKTCLPMVNTFLNLINERIAFIREAPNQQPMGKCQFDFFLLDPL